MKLVRKVNFDICTYCNHRCNFCSNSDYRTVKSQVSLNEFVKIMTNLTQYVEVSELGLSAKGEILINKDITPIIQASKNLFAISYVYFSTNGALLTRSKSIELLEAGIDSIKFSINALNAEEYKKVHDADDFRLVIQNLKDLLLLKKERFGNVKIMISSVIDLSENELKKFFSSFLGDLFTLVDQISLYPITYTPKFKIMQAHSLIGRSCSIPFKEIYINSNGTLGLCCKDYFDEINFGSLMHYNFSELYNCKAYEEIRTMHETKIFPDNHLCKNCLLYEEVNDV